MDSEGSGEQVPDAGDAVTGEAAFFATCYGSNNSQTGEQSPPAYRSLRPARAPYCLQLRTGPPQGREAEGTAHVRHAAGIHQRREEEEEEAGHLRPLLATDRHPPRARAAARAQRARGGAAGGRSDRPRARPQRTPSPAQQHRLHRADGEGARAVTGWRGYGMTRHPFPAHSVGGACAFLPLPRPAPPCACAARVRRFPARCGSGG